MHATTAIFHGGGLARFFAAGSGPASGGGVGFIQGGLPIGGFVWVHGVSDFLRESHPQGAEDLRPCKVERTLFLLRIFFLVSHTKTQFSPWRLIHSVISFRFIILMYF
jgi:hypothetical protein